MKPETQIKLAWVSVVAVALVVLGVLVVITWQDWKAAVEALGITLIVILCVFGGVWGGYTLLEHYDRYDG